MRGTSRRPVGAGRRMPALANARLAAAATDALFADCVDDSFSFHGGRFRRFAAATFRLRSRRVAVSACRQGVSAAQGRRRCPRRGQNRPGEQTGHEAGSHEHQPSCGGVALGLRLNVPIVFCRARRVNLEEKTEDHAVRGRVARRATVRFHYASSFLITVAGSTPVNRWSRPWWRKLNRSWSKPSRCSTVAWKSRMWTGSLTML